MLGAARVCLDGCGECTVQKTNNHKTEAKMMNGMRPNEWIYMTKHTTIVLNTQYPHRQNTEYWMYCTTVCHMLHALRWGKSHRIRFVFICVCLVSSHRKRIETKRQYNVPTIEKARLLNWAVLRSSKSNHIVAQFTIQMRSLQMIRAYPFYAFACRWFFSHLDQR